jgi:hypothetical protein
MVACYGAQLVRFSEASIVPKATLAEKHLLCLQNIRFLRVSISISLKL